MRSIDYRAVKDLIDAERVLTLIGWHPQKRYGDQWRGYCPLAHNGHPNKRGAFSVNVTRGCWRCFACGRRGNLLDLYGAVTRQPLYAAAEDLCRRLGITVPRLRRQAGGRTRFVVRGVGGRAGLSQKER